MTSDEIKAWVLSRDPLGWERPMRDQIILALQGIGFQRIRVAQVIHHPVWNVSAQVGQFRAEGVRDVKRALKKVCGELGFKTRMNEIVASLYKGRLNAAFALMPRDTASVEVEDDGEWLPEHLEAAP